VEVENERHDKKMVYGSQLQRITQLKYRTQLNAIMGRGTMGAIEGVEKRIDEGRERKRELRGKWAEAERRAEDGEER